jgi:hypothetical protein
MIEYLIAAPRQVGYPLSFRGYPARWCGLAILRTNLAVIPAEILFDAIEAKLERRSVEL